MSGHSHWAGIKHKKGLADAKRGKLFSKLAKNITLAARDGGADLSTNLKLRYAIDKAKEANMPKANIERAVNKGTGQGGASNLCELTYEGYGPGGIAIMAEIVTDNKNRVASELRKVFETGGGKLGESGCVSYMFNRKGFFSVPASSIDEDTLMNIALEAEAENLQQEGDFFEITCAVTNFTKVQSALAQAEVKVDIAELMQIPQTTVTLNEENAKKVMYLMDKLEDYDDIQNVYSNFDIPDDIMAKIQENE